MSHLSRIKYLIYLLILAYLAACGRNFKTLEPETLKALETPATTAPESKDPTKSEKNDKKEPVAATSELWVQEIPNKYDDVGDFFRIKEVPGLQKDQVIDSMPMSQGSNKTLKLIRGKLRLSKVTHHFDSATNQLEVKGDVVFDDGNPLAFVLAGPMGNGEIPLKIKDDKSALKDLFRAKAVCSVGASVDDQTKVDVADYCRRLTIDFYYRHQDTFYTDQLISKDILFDEIKKTESAPEAIPDPIFADIPDEGLSDYEKAQKKGFSDGVVDPNAVDELPYYFSEPSIDDVATLYPDVSKDVEAQKKSFFKQKKIKAVPKLTGDEKIPEKDGQSLPPLPDFDDTKNPTVPQGTSSPKPPATTPTPNPKPPVKTPQPTPKPPVTTPTPNPKPPTPITPVAPDPSRPVDQAWGMPHTGKYNQKTKKMMYLTNSSSLLEAWQKLGVNAGFEVRFPTRKRHYGTYDMVELVVNIGEWVRQNVPGLPIAISDIAAVHGGRIGEHSSHKTGMDIDIAYLTKNPKMTFMNIDTNVAKGSYTHADFNAAAQWQLLKASYEFAPIEVIYVNRRVKQEMCRQALKAGDLKSNTDTKSDAAVILTKLVVIDSNHGNHWHLRLDCNPLKLLKLQKECISHPQPYVGPECQKITP